MKRFLAFVWHKHRIAGLVFCAAFLVLIFMVTQFTMKTIHFADPANQDRPLELWMPPRYVEHSWGLTKPIMFNIIGVEPGTPHEEIPHSVGEILQKTGMTLEELQAKVEAAQQNLREQQGQ